MKNQEINHFNLGTVVVFDENNGDIASMTTIIQEVASNELNLENKYVIQQNECNQFCSEAQLLHPNKKLKPVVIFNFEHKDGEEYAIDLKSENIVVKRTETFEDFRKRKTSQLKK